MDNNMLRRSLRRKLFATTSSDNDHVSTASSKKASLEKTTTTTTPRKRRRKIQQEKTRTDEKSIPSTPDLCDSPVTENNAPCHEKSKKALIDDEGFIDLNVPPLEFRPSASLTTGQSFHWKALPGETADASDHKAATSSSAWGAHDATDWMGTLRVTATGDTIVVHVRETSQTTLYKVLHAPTDDLDVDSFLRDYFQLHVGLQDLCATWSAACPRLHQIARCIPGVRILQQVIASVLKTDLKDLVPKKLKVPAVQTFDSRISRVVECLSFFVKAEFGL